MTQEIDDKELSEFLESIYDSSEIEMLSEMGVEIKVEHEGSEEVRAVDGTARKPTDEKLSTQVIYNIHGEIDFEAMEANSKVVFTIE